MESVNDGSAVDETEIEIDQIMERTEQQKSMLDKIVGVMTSEEKCYYGGFEKL